MSVSGFYTSFHKYGNKILVRGVTDAGERYSDMVDFKPELFIKTPPGEKSDAVDFMTNLPMSRVEFANIKEAENFLETYKGVHNFKIGGYNRWEHQFAARNWDINHVIKTWDKSKIRIAGIDIETEVNGGFPKPELAREPINIVTISDSIDKVKYVWGTGDWNGTRKDVVYTRCFSEKQLLNGVISYFIEKKPDVLKGWNIEPFDVVYLCRRIETQIGENGLKALSPFGKVKVKTVAGKKGDELRYNIVGIQIIDLLLAYKKFVLTPRESYKLDTIGKVEVNETKLKHHSGLPGHLLYREYFSDGVDYNIQDVDLMDKIDDKRNLVSLIMTVAYKAGANYTDVFSQIRIWDNALYLLLRSEGRVFDAIPPKKEYRPVVGGYVKDPIRGRHKWMISVDATSEYPSIIRALNLSPETIVNDFEGPSGVEHHLFNRPDTSELRKLNYTMGANGVAFRRDFQGLMPRATKILFDERQSDKKVMLYHKGELQKFKKGDPVYEKHDGARVRYDLSQGSAKVRLNSLFGASANEFFRFFDPNIAEAITMTGQLMIRTVAEAINKYLNKICKTDGKDYVVAIDTDSVMFTIGDFVEKMFNGQDRDKIVDAIDQFIDNRIQPIINESIADLCNRLNAFEPEALVMKREAIASSGVFVEKKRYAMNVLDNEGVRFAEPDLKITGLAAVSASNPGKCREWMKKAITTILEGTEDELHNTIAKMRSEFFSMSPDEIAQNVGITEVEKYLERDGSYKKGTQAHIRAAIIYNATVKKLNLMDNRPLIDAGDKMKMVYLQNPNKMFSNVMGWLEEWPTEFGVDDRVDYNTQFQKVFIAGIERITDAVGWDVERRGKLDIFE